MQLQCYILAALRIQIIMHWMESNCRGLLLERFCDLGTQNDSKLKFHIQLQDSQAVVKKASLVLGLICKSFECKDSAVTVKLYITLVCQIIECSQLIILMFYGDLSMYLITKNQKDSAKSHHKHSSYLSATYCTYYDTSRHLNLPSLQHCQ